MGDKPSTTGTMPRSAISSLILSGLMVRYCDLSIFGILVQDRRLTRTAKATRDDRPALTRNTGCLCVQIFDNGVMESVALV